jgi:nicotinic acid mononucleotide adenylyltransferase
LNIQIIDIEIKNKFLPTYKLLEELKIKYPNYNFELIVGSEIIDQYRTWEKGNELKNQYKFIILERPDKKFDESNLPTNYRILKISIDLGDSNIKERISKKDIKKKNFGINAITSKSVIKYIYDNNLYQT